MIERDMASVAEIVPRLAGDDSVRVDLRGLRTAFVQGLYEGGLSKKRYARSAMLESGRFRVLLVADAPATASTLEKRIASVSCW